MKRKIISLLFIAVLAVSLLLTFTSCGSSDDISGVTLQAGMHSLTYNDQSNTSSLTVSISATNRNSDLDITSFDYKIYFFDDFGNVIYTSTLKYENTLEPDEDASFSANFINVTTGYEPDYQGGVNAPRVPGKVASVRVVPVSMVTVEADSSGSSSDSDSGWGFWTWFWVVIAGILIILFLMCCLGAEGDTDAIIGGVIIFLAPALIILFVHFVFFF